MTNFKSIIKQLSEKDYHAIKVSLKDSNADKSMMLLESVRGKGASDEEIMAELSTTGGAYYALRSRLVHRIEEYLIEQMETPRTDLVKKVSNINEVLFTKKRTLAIATLKKLEKELIDFDLSNELTFIYKCLKKLHINHPNYFHYSQLYNRHVAYMLAMDKAEDLLSEYFKKYGEFTLTGLEIEKTGLKLIRQEMSNVCNLYQSHRLYVLNSFMNIFHRLFVEKDDENITDLDEEPTEDVLQRNEEIINSYKTDKIYFHLNIVLEYLRLGYYTHFNVYRKAERYYQEVNIHSSRLLSNYNLYTFPSNFLVLKIDRALRLGSEADLSEEAFDLYEDLQPDKHDLPQFYIYSVFRGLASYYSDNYDEAAKWINTLINDLTWKKYPLALLEARLFLNIQFLFKGDKDLAKQINGSIQRQIRALGKENCEVAFAFQQILKISTSHFKKDKRDKIQEVIRELEKITTNYFSPLKLIRLDEKFVEILLVKTK